MMGPKSGLLTHPNDGHSVILGVVIRVSLLIRDETQAPDFCFGGALAEIEVGLSETYFAWSGPLAHEPAKNGSSYYRIQGPRLVIEFSPQGFSGENSMHVPTIYRNPTNDHGVKLTGAE